MAETLRQYFTLSRACSSSSAQSAAGGGNLAVGAPVSWQETDVPFVIAERANILYAKNP